MKAKFILAAALALLMCHFVLAQTLTWAHQFGGMYDDYAFSISVDAAGNVYTTGSYNDTTDFDPGPGTTNLTPFGGGKDVFISKLNTSGDFVWAKQFGGTDYDEGRSIAVDAAENVYVIGDFAGTADFDPGTGTFNLTSFGNRDIFITKLDVNGNLLWAKQLGGISVDGGLSIAVDAVGNVYATGDFAGTADFDPGPGIFNFTSAAGSDIFIIKLNVAGNLVWAKQFSGTGYDRARSIAIDTAGNVYTTGDFTGTTDFDPSPAMLNLTSAGNFDGFVAKLDTSGNLVWVKQFGGIDDVYGYSVAVDAAGYVYATGFFSGLADFDPGLGIFNLTSFGNYDVFVTKLDDSGSLLWAKQFGGLYTVHGHSIFVGADGSVYASGSFLNTADFDPGPGTFNLTSPGSYGIFITKLNASGHFVWAKQLGGISSHGFGSYVVVDTAKNLYATGYFQGTGDFDPSPDTFNLTSAGLDIFILKLKLPAEVTPFIIEGKVFADANSNCSTDTSEIALPNVIVKADPGPFYGLSNSDGDYSIYLFDTGSYTISLVTEDTIWQPICSTSYNIQLSGTPDTINGLSFAMQASYYCPRLTVEVGAPLIRRCFNNTYSISYGNTGTLPAFNAYIEIDFGHHLLPQSSTIPWSSVNGNIYTFPIGNLNINQQGSFTVTAQLSCNAPLGSTQCVTARIYPDSSCFTPDPAYDRRQMYVYGECVPGDSVQFTIWNAHTSNTHKGHFEIYVNSVLTDTIPFYLTPGDTTIVKFPPNGNTIRLEIKFQGIFPGPQYTVEGCGSPAIFGNVNTLPQNDDDLNIETFCTTVLGSYDPNDKQVFPTGVTANRYITSETELEYLIRFQNTGNDTAFLVVIRDTIDTDVLDIATLTSGASSHEYTFNIYGPGIAEWTFDNILLPDSNVNEPESHGFVKYKIHQLPGNPDGTLIENRAAIYFDFNTPVITNTAWNMVNEANMPTAFLSTSIANTSDAKCFGDSTGVAEVSATGGLAPYQYVWSNGETTPTVSNLASGNYSVTITDAIGKELTESVSISEPSQLTAVIDSTSNVLCYGNGTGSATASASGGTSPYSYEWSDTQDSQTATNLNAGTYTVTVWDANLCTATTSSITITEPPQLTASISTQSAVTCFGGNDAGAKANPTGGVGPYGFLWSNGDTLGSVADLSAGNYTVTVTDSNGCWLVTSVTIQDGYQINTGIITGIDSANINQTSTYSVNAGFAYNWSVTNGTIISGQNTNSIEVSWNTAGQGSLEVVISDQGCSETVSKTVTVSDPTGIQGNNFESLTIIPNPTSDKILIEWSPKAIVTQIILLDICGKVLLETIPSSPIQHELTLQQYEVGIYFIAVKGDGQRTMRVVKM